MTLRATLRAARTAAMAVALPACLLLSSLPVSAQNFGLEEAVGSVTENRPSSFKNVTNDPAIFIGRVIAMALSLVGTLFLVLMLYGGFLWMTARGDSKMTDKAKSLIASAVIGVMIVAGAYVITRFVVQAIVSGGESGGTSQQPGGGQSCTQSNQCPGTEVCKDGKCVAPNSGSCVVGKTCINDAECESNGSCAGGSCVCDPI